MYICMDKMWTKHTDKVHMKTHSGACMSGARFLLVFSHVPSELQAMHRVHKCLGMIATHMYLYFHY